MAWQMVDDLTGDVVPEGQDHRLSLHLDTSERLDAAGNDTEVRAWDVASTDPAELLAQLGEHLSGKAAPLGPDAGPLPGSDQVRDALRRRGVMVCGPGEISDALDVPLGRRIHEGLRTLDLPWRVEVALRRLGYRLAAALDGAPSDDDTMTSHFDGGCPEDPDGLHFPTCGCDGVDPVNPNDPNDPAEDPPADVRDELNAAGEANATVQLTGEQPAEADTDAASEQVGEAASGRPTPAQLRTWALSHGLPVSTTGGIKKWVGLAYDRVAGGRPDDRAWRDGAADGGSWTRPDGTVVTRQGATPPGASQPSATTRPGAENPPPPASTPPAGRAAADPDPTTAEPSTSAADEGAPLPDRNPSGRAAGTATETPEPAVARRPGGTPAPAPPVVPERAPAVAPAGDGSRARPEQIDLADELAADGATPMTIVNRTGVALETARELVSKAKGPRR